LGDRDPMPIHESTPAKVQQAIAGLDDAVLRKPERPGKWSILEVIQHLADSELVYGYRIRMIVSHPTPDIQGFDQDLWARELGYGQRDVRDALAEFRGLRESNVRLLKWLAPEKIERYGNHSERGKESVARMLKLYAAHDLVHLKQIERIKQTVVGGR
jgi:uncharacterized damage-inducible protein DinB